MQYNPAMLEPRLVLPALNRLLDTQPALRTRLARHAGKQAAIRLPLFSLRFAVDVEGRLGASDPAQPLATEIDIGPELLIGLATQGGGALKRARVRGDGLLASDLSAAFDDFDWVLALRPVLGDMAAARAAQAIDGLGQWRQQAHESVGRSIAEYATFEAGMLVDPESIRQFVADVDALRDDLARLEARLALLEKQAG